MASAIRTLIFRNNQLLSHGVDKNGFSPLADYLVDTFDLFLVTNGILLLFMAIIHNLRLSKYGKER